MTFCQQFISSTTVDNAVRRMTQWCHIVVFFLPKILLSLARPDRHRFYYIADIIVFENFGIH